MKRCDQVVEALAEGTALDADHRVHVAGCPDCGALVALGRAHASEVDTLPPALREALRRDARPVEAFTPWRRAAPVVATAAGLAGLVWALAPRADLAHQPASRLGLGLVTLAAGLLASLTVLLHGGRHGIGLSPRVRWAFAAVAFAFVELVTAAITVPVDGSLHLGGAAAWQARLGCALHGTLVAAVAGLVVLWGARRSASVAPVSAGVVAGIVAGIVGALAQHLQCPVMDLDHTLVAHLAPLLAGALAGAFVGRRWLSP